MAMSLETAVSEALGENAAGGIEEFQHTPNDLVLVADTNFIIRLSRRDVWAYQALLMAQSLAKKAGKRWLWRAPIWVMRKYDSFLANGTVDDTYKIPLAQCSLEELFGNFSGLSLGVAPVSISSAKSAAPVSGREDRSVITFADGLARQGAEVYLVSYDIKDIIVGVRRWNKKHEGSGLKIEPLPPSPVQLQYFRESKLELRELVTLDVLAQLQTARSTPAFYPVVIFETGVMSRDAVFDAGVGVVQKRYFVPLERQLPASFDSIRTKFRAVPVLKVKSLEALSAANVLTKNLKAWRQQFGAGQFVVVEEQSPFSPMLVSTSGSTKPFFTAGLDFLYWQANSAFAQANYKPVSQR